MTGEGRQEPFDDSSAEPGVWRYAKAERVRVVIDADDYFDVMQRAMLKARRLILLIGWDFDTRIHLNRGRRWWQKGRRRQFPSRLGSFIPWLTRHNRELDIRILKWGVGALKFAMRGTMALDLMRWFPHRQIDFKFDTAHPVACSHHQKIVVIDRQLAVCGGIDMTDGRWDTREHRARDRRRKRPGGAEYGPWHDATMLMEGLVAAALEDLGRERWKRAGGKQLPPVREAGESPWPDDLEPHFRDVEIGIARTRAEYGDCPGIDEIEQLFRAHIARAKEFIYAESQYFASRAVAEAIAARMAEPDPPEIVIVHPNSADGWIESAAMDPARARLAQAIEAADTHGRFHLFMPYSGETPIYVHAKLMIVDDEILRIGSANINNRSMGLDSECDVFIDCRRPANKHCGETIRALRHSLLAEHCGVPEQDVARLLDEAGSMAEMIARNGQPGGRHLRLYRPEELSDLEAELADRQMLDPEEPAEMFRLTPPRRGLFRSGSLLARTMDRVKRKRRRT